MENLTEMLKGILDGRVLEIIRHHETYGYEITRRLNELSFSNVVEGTVYTILIRLEKMGLSTLKNGPPRWDRRENSIR